MRDLTGRRRHEAGFTLVETLAVVLILGIMSGVAVVSGTKSRALGRVDQASDGVASSLRLARELAVARSATVTVTATGTPVRLVASSTGLADQTLPLEADGVTLTIPGGSVQFLSTGQVDIDNNPATAVASGTTKTITVTGQQTLVRYVVLIASTGRVCDRSKVDVTAAANVVCP